MWSRQRSRQVRVQVLDRVRARCGSRSRSGPALVEPRLRSAAFAESVVMDHALPPRGCLRCSLAGTAGTARGRSRSGSCAPAPSGRWPSSAVSGIGGVRVRVVGWRTAACRPSRAGRRPAAAGADRRARRAAGWSGARARGCTPTGARLTHGTRRRRFRHSLSKRHMWAGSQVKPDSSRATRSVGNWSKTPSLTMLVSWRGEDLGHAGVLLEEVRGPAGRRGRVAGRAAEVDRRRPGRGGRSPPTAGGRCGCRSGCCGADRQQHLDEAGVVADALDLLRRPGPAAGSGTTIEARRRGSLSSHSAICQSLTALANATAASGLCRLSMAYAHSGSPISTSASSSTWRRTVSRSEAAGMTPGTFEAGRPSAGLKSGGSSGRLPGRAATGEVGG